VVYLFDLQNEKSYMYKVAKEGESVQQLTRSGSDTRITRQTLNEKLSIRQDVD
jgi:hypothetical protein